MGRLGKWGASVGLVIVGIIGLARGQEDKIPLFGSEPKKDNPKISSFLGAPQVPTNPAQPEALPYVPPPQLKLAEPIAPPTPVGPQPPPVAVTPTPATTHRPSWLFGDPARVNPRFTIRQDTGDSVGYQRGFVWAEAFAPLLQVPNHAVLFADARAVNFLQGNLWEWNMGLGGRWRPNSCPWIFGANTFFDWRDTGRSTFRQVGFGLEALGPIVELRGNFYLPVGNRRNFLQDTVGNPQFAGFNILLDRTSVYENAMRGFNLEIGAPVPYMERIGLRAYAGYYHYDNAGAPTVDGARARLEAQVTDYMSLHLQVQSDRVFDTTVQGGIAFQLGTRRPAGAIRTPNDLLGQRVVRDPNIVVAQSTEVTKEVALDPTTKLPIVVRHVSSYADRGGNGTFERPYRTLEKLELNSQPGDILFAHVNSVLTDQYIVLRDRQRLLGEGILHQIVTAQGSFYLPNRPGNAPLIYQTCSCSDSITLANNNEVSGFAVDQPGLSAVYGDSIKDFNINRNVFTNPGSESIYLTNTSGTGVIANNTFGQTMSTSGTAGFRIIDSSGTLRVTIANNTTYGHTDASGIIETSSGNILAILRGNNFTESTGGLRATSYGGILGMHFVNNSSTAGYELTESGGTFLLADTRETNTGTFNLFNNVMIVPVEVLYSAFP